MPSFQYSALDANGQSLSGRIDAAGRAEAITSLVKQDIYVTQIDSPDKKAQTAAASPGLRWSRRVPLRLKSSMLRQLATALQAGLPLLSALQVVHKQAQNQALRALLADLAERVQSGEAFSQAMAQHARDFSPLETSMVRVGETAGVLDQVMGYLSEFAEHDLDIREKIRSAAAYPLFVLGVAAISVVIIVTFILPGVISSITESIGQAALPMPTQILMGVSNFLRDFGWLVLIALALGIWGFRAWLAKPEGRLAFDTFKLRIPVLGTAIRRIAVGRFARTLGTLSKSGIPILDALRVLRDTLGNEALAQKIDQAAAGITQGQSVAEPLAQTGEFPPLLIQVIAMGEQTGKLDELLLQTADAYEKETSAAIGRVMTILPAVFIVLLALLVAFILVAVLLPIITMQTSLPGM
ncbi:MAG: type II secretion system F family protein [Phycisphaerae bacterium]|nr:type II secretion system F family protein [Phycisphaerae bacterium]